MSLMWGNGMNFVRFTELVGICEETVRNVDFEEYDTGVCDEFGLYTHTPDLYGSTIA